ncbi:MAG TPA: DUF6527 family protein [Vicinamibacterales bacterium]|jgi:hypothetical protein|nr:DUF6527 family protein [Vicinamibacterales bacterium]
MRLVDLHPDFLNAGGPGIYQQTDRPCEACGGSGCDTCHNSGKAYEPAPRINGVGVEFDCPCGNHDEQHRCYVPFENPIGGGPTRQGWRREGETFETLTITPSILRNRARGGCGWHGWITRGDVTGQVEG